MATQHQAIGYGSKIASGIKHFSRASGIKAFSKLLASSTSLSIWHHALLWASGSKPCSEHLASSPALCLPTRPSLSFWHQTLFEHLASRPSLSFWHQALLWVSGIKPCSEHLPSRPSLSFWHQALFQASAIKAFSKLLASSPARRIWHQGLL